MEKSKAKPSNASLRDSQHDRRTQLVKDMVAKESAALDAKTVRLKALRMAREAEEAANPAPKPVKATRRRKT